MTQPIPTLDLMWLLLETPACPTHVGALLVFQKPPKAATGFASRLVKAYRGQRPTAPFDFVPDLSLPGRPRFRTAATYDPKYHVQHVVLPHGGTYDDALRLVADLHEPTLDRDRPLFRLWIMDGLPGDRFALYLKIHHAIVDGATAQRRVQASLSADPAEDLRPAPFAVELPTRTPRVQPTWQVRASEIAARVRMQALTLATLSGQVLRRSLPVGIADLASRPFTAARAPMNASIHRGRSYATLTLPFDEMRAVARHFEATLNDVAVTIVDAGVHRYLERTGRAFDHRLIAMLPVSLRSETDTEGGTQASAMFSPLGESKATTVDRLQQVKASVAAGKQELRSMSRDTAMTYASAVLGVAGIAGATGLDRWMPPLANLVISNVPGERAAAYLGGAHLVGAFPISAIAAGVGLNVTFTSAEGRMDFGFVGDGVVMHGMAGLADATLEAFRELQKPVAVKRRSGRAAARGRRRASGSPRSA